MFARSVLDSCVVLSRTRRSGSKGERPTASPSKVKAPALPGSSAAGLSLMGISNAKGPRLWAFVIAKTTAAGLEEPELLQGACLFRNALFAPAAPVFFLAG